tara:strand:+ start:6458 stop:6976 length:519 start_codon:yes stop_codon:yes gene_type:complete
MKFDGIKYLNLATFQDHRGEFCEMYNHGIMEHFDERFIQTNISKSRQGVFRGLHYQWDDPMGKLIAVLHGEIIDFWIDVRQGSPTYGETGKMNLKDSSPTLLYLPPGFAHGFYSVTDSVVKYECTAYYNKHGEGAISYKEIADVAQDGLIISEKDKRAPRFSEYKEDAKFIY